MNELQKRRVKTVFKYTWPLYIVSTLIIVFGMNFLFQVTHRLPAYKSLTLFVSGQVTDDKKLTNDLLSKYQDNELKNVSFVECDPSDGSYLTRIKVVGYNSADILIIPVSILETKINCSALAAELKDELIADYYQGFTFYKENDLNFGVKVDKEKVKTYMALPNEDCYMLLNGASENLGEYSKKGVKERDNALNVVKDWGI